MPDRPTATPQPDAPVRVRAVVPCFNRPGDLDALLGDLEALHRECDRGPIDLRVIVVDNASHPPLVLPPTAGPAYRMLRLPTNTGGSGGFNAGLSAWLDIDPADGPDDFLWLLDSDVRVRPGTLRGLVDALLADPGVVGAGPLLADPADWTVHEVGGCIARSDAYMRPALHPDEIPSDPAPIECDYVAACCALVRRSAVEHVGLLPDRFLNADDSEWFIRLSRATGGRVVVLPSYIAAHPRFDRFATWPRYYAGRNCMGPARALGLGRVARLRRTLAEMAKAVSLTMLDRDDLADLHVRAIRDGAAGRTLGPADPPLAALTPMIPAREFARAISAASSENRLPVWIHPRVPKREHEYAWVFDSLRQAGITPVVQTEPDHEPKSAALGMIARLALALARALVSPPARIAIVPATGKPGSWLAGRIVFAVTHDSYWESKARGWDRLRRAISTVFRALAPALRLGLQPAAPDTLALRVPGLSTFVDSARRPARAAPFSVVVLSYSRRDSLRSTLLHLSAHDPTRDAEIIVVDNHSTDGSPEMVRREFPTVRLIALPENTAVAGFNRGVAEARGDLVLVLDDDAQPDPAGLTTALDQLRTHANVAAIPLHPRHPTTGRSEWAFAEGAAADELRRAHRWPVLGCANLVRRDAWLAVGGYDPALVLYRNDVDLALKLLGAGYGIGFDPSRIVWHDSPAADRKSRRWFELATRNWIWLARRHARGMRRVSGAVLGWGWAHKLAGINLRDHVAVISGALRGIFRRPPQLFPVVRPTGAAFADLLRLQLSGRSGRPRTVTRTRPTPEPSPPATELDGPPPEVVVLASTAAESSERHSA